MGMGDWGLGIGDWGLGPIPNPQSPIPNPQSPFYIYIHLKLNSLFKKNILIILFYYKNILIKLIMKKLDIDKYKEIFENNNNVKGNKESETFKKLRELQKLIKKESSLKELCN